MKSNLKFDFTTTLSVFVFLLLAFPAGPGWAVTSKITRQGSSADFLKGTIKDVVIGSQGTIELGRAAEVLADEFEDVWSINSIVVSGGTIFFGTSPNGGIFKYSLGKVTKIYPLISQQDQDSEEDKRNHTDPNDANVPGDANVPSDANVVTREKYLTNEHIFAMSTDVAGRLLVGISGENCRLMRFESGRMNTIFEPNDARYIFAIASGPDNIFLGTGPEGKIYQLDSFGENPQLVYDSLDKNILSLAIGQDGFLYAGTDERGLIYKINPRTKTARALYDSEQPEITALLISQDGTLYAAATSAQITQAETKFASQLALGGRPEQKPKKTESPEPDKSGLKLKIPNTQRRDSDKQAERRKAHPKPPTPAKASYLYKISPQGYVTDAFEEAAVFFCLTKQNDRLLLGTGNSAQLFSIEPDSEKQAIIFEDEQASQITSIAVSGEDVYLGTANPAKLVRLGRTFAYEGTYTSDLIDATQPARWGKLQIEADIPQGCKVEVSSRSGNVKDVNDPTFSDWTEPAEVTGPIQLRCPLGRFCQYKLVLQSPDGQKSPLIREVAVAYTVPNLAPKVELVTVELIKTPAKKGFFKIDYKASDDNGDKLIYKIDFRKIGRKNWIQMKDKLEADNFEWDGKTVEDGRYEIRITASDEPDNDTTTKLTGSRVSDPVVVDNTPPVIEANSIRQNGRSVTLKFHVADKLSAIGQVRYSVDSSTDWNGLIPQDLVYDTTDEDFTVAIADLKPGEHIIAVKAADDAGNVTYRTFDVTVTSN